MTNLQTIALERTFLSYIRSALYLVSAGLYLTRGFHTSVNDATYPYLSAARPLGLLFCLAGAICTLLAIRRLFLGQVWLNENASATLSKIGPLVISGLLIGVSTLRPI